MNESIKDFREVLENPENTSKILTKLNRNKYLSEGNLTEVMQESAEETVKEPQCHVWCDTSPQIHQETSK